MLYMYASSQTPAFLNGRGILGWGLRVRRSLTFCRKEHIYLRQVNGGDNVFVRCLSVCLSVCVRSGPVNQTSLKRLKLTDFKFDMHVLRNSPDK